MMASIAHIDEIRNSCIKHDTHTVQLIATVITDFSYTDVNSLYLASR